MPGLDEPKARSLSPPTYPMIIWTTIPTHEGKTNITVQIPTRSTVSDVIQNVLDGLSILNSTEHFDLCEVYSEFGVFPTDPDAVFENSRTLNYGEHPLIVKKNWSASLHANGVDRSALSESETEDKAVPFERYRLYLTQKSDSVRVGSDVKVTWLDGLPAKVAPEDWHFEPNYREAEDIDDLVSLPVLNENVLLDELCKRFCRGRIYTYVGGILIAVNPFKYFPIYNPKYVNAYQHKKLGELPPHVFAIADVAYNRMLQNKHDECIVISGESGSGKTESTKLILHHLTALSHKTKATVLEKTILAAGPVLEAFGNAKTCHNNNSSRFGKFTQINYRADGVVCGAILKKYLLEKSRIVSQGANERNYHVFYAMLSGASTAEVEKLHLRSPEDYHYLNQTECYNIEGMDEVFEFARLKNAIKNIGISTATQQRMFAVLSAVLHIGNITFKKRTFPEDSVSVADESIVDIISDLLQVEKLELIQPMTMRKTITRGEEFVRQYKKDEAIATRDSMAKCLYASLFDWIVVQTNHILASRQGRRTEKKAFSIGVLDIFGFEDFETNSFEQFCINLANENLQYYLNQHIFKLRQDEYIEEGLEWDHVDYVDNATCLNLIVGKPTGLILLLDEECSLTMGTDESLQDKFNKHHANNPCYEMPPTKEPVFSIVHYAGKVKYKIKGFRAKNRELMRNDVVSAFKNSRMLFMRELMGSDPIAIYYWSILRHMIKAVSIFKKAGQTRARGEKMFEHKPSVKWASGTTPPKTTKILMQKLTESDLEPINKAIMRRANKVMNKRVHDLAKRVQSPSKVRSGLQARKTISGGMPEFARRGGLKQPPTVIAQFQSSLQELMDTLNSSHPFFVRCIRSNSTKAPLEFDAELVLRQLRYTGMLETVKIRQAGYPVRIFVKDFLTQFKVLLTKDMKNDVKDSDLTEHLTSIGLDPQEFQIGAKKVFMRESQYQLLREKRQQKVDNSIALIQVWYRNRLLRKQKQQQHTSAVKIQTIWRCYRCKREYQKQLTRHLAAVRIQQFWRSSRYRTIGKLHFERFKKSVVKIQSLWRGCKCRMEYPKVLQAKLEAKENEQIRENAENIMHDVLKDTMFDEGEEEKVVEATEIRATELNIVEPAEPEPVKAPIAKKDVHIYEDITNFDSIFKPGEQFEEKNAKVVKLRTQNYADQESRKQKLIRRLSFTHKDKQKSLVHLRKSCEAEDLEIINTSVFANPLPASLPPSNKSCTIPQTQDNTHNTSSHNTSKFANLFTLTRKSSKRETPKERKSHRRPSGSGENDYVVKGETELEALNNFLMKKVTDMNKPEPDRKSDSDVDVVFKHALHKYHGTLLMTCAKSDSRGEEILLKFNDFIHGFQETLEIIVNQGENKVSKEFLVIGGNLFRGIIEEFQKNKEKLVLSGKRRTNNKHIKRKRRRTAEFYEYKGHIYVFHNFNIRTYCEQCNSYIYDKGLVCQACTFTCHKKCYKQNSRTCKGRRPSLCGPAALFGTDLSEITSPNNPIPQAIIKLVVEIERKGLYSLGIYRKPGLQAGVNNLKSVLTSVEAEDLIFEDEKPHTLASVLKLFFRQLPKPMIPKEFYDDFLRSTDLESEAEIHSTLYELIQRFPKANRELLERLIVHLGRVATLEEHNRMSPNALAIIWAPCLLRAPDDGDPLEALAQLPKTTKCVEILIDSQVKSRKAMLSDIQALQRAESTAENHLDNIMRDEETGDEEIDGAQREKNEELKSMLQNEITNMEMERDRLTNALADIVPPKTRSIDSVDELGSDADFNLRGSFEILTFPEELKRQSSVSNDTPSTPTSAGKRRLLMGEANDSSFEDLSCTPQPSHVSSENQAIDNH